MQLTQGEIYLSARLAALAQSVRCLPLKQETLSSSLEPMLQKPVIVVVELESRRSLGLTAQPVQPDQQGPNQWPLVSKDLDDVPEDDTQGWPLASITRMHTCVHMHTYTNNNSLPLVSKFGQICIYVPNTPVRTQSKSLVPKGPPCCSCTVRFRLLQFSSRQQLMSFLCLQTIPIFLEYSET